MIYIGRVKCGHGNPQDSGITMIGEINKALPEERKRGLIIKYIFETVRLREMEIRDSV